MSYQVQYYDTKRNVQLSANSLYLCQEMQNGQPTLQMKGNDGSDKFKFTVFDYDTTSPVHDIVNVLVNKVNEGGQRHVILVFNEGDEPQIKLEPLKQYIPPGMHHVSTTDRRFFYNYEPSLNKQAFEIVEFTGKYIGVQGKHDVYVDSSQFDFDVIYPYVEPIPQKSKHILTKSGLIETNKGLVLTTQLIETGLQVVAVDPKMLHPTDDDNKINLEKVEKDVSDDTTNKQDVSGTSNADNTHLKLYPKLSRTSDPNEGDSQGQSDSDSKPLDINTFNDPLFDMFFYNYYEAPEKGKRPAPKTAIVAYHHASQTYLSYQVRDDDTTGPKLVPQSFEKFKTRPGDIRFPDQRFFILDRDTNTEKTIFKVHDDQASVWQGTPVPGASAKEVNEICIKNTHTPDFVHGSQSIVFKLDLNLASAVAALALGGCGSCCCPSRSSRTCTLL